MTWTPPPWRAMREAAGITLRELSRRTEINPGRISMIERGIQPTADEERLIREELARALLGPPTAVA